MFAFWKEKKVFETKDKAAFLAAENRLAEAGIQARTWTSPESPMVCCCAKIDVRLVGRKEHKLLDVYHIAVASEDAERALQLLEQFQSTSH
ncbi:MAG: hypothetical protein MR630_09240 [Selenomonas sp.]|uniref:hypothetical protein n=1 Tax=Selenomonas sp. TaxID=2053611 RepID=UPI0025F40A0E|nr:hypothetical protein [Selenomonas sp.]MCI6232776.1 hypothetical protein [Selenomonas sp.]